MGGGFSRRGSKSRSKSRSSRASSDRVASLKEKAESMQEVLPGIFMGAAEAAGELENLKSMGVTHIIAIGWDLTIHFPGAFDYLLLTGVEDQPNYFLLQHFEVCFEFMNHCLKGTEMSKALMSKALKSGSGDGSSSSTAAASASTTTKSATATETALSKAAEAVATDAPAEPAQMKRMRTIVDLNLVEAETVQAEKEAAGHTGDDDEFSQSLSDGEAAAESAAAIADDMKPESTGSGGDESKEDTKADGDGSGGSGSGSSSEEETKEDGTSSTATATTTVSSERKTREFKTSANFKLTLQLREDYDSVWKPGTQGKLFVHCHKGLSRSASVIIGYYMRENGLSFETVLAKIRETRSFIMPNIGFQAQLIEYEKQGYSLDMSGYKRLDISDRISALIPDMLGMIDNTIYKFANSRGDEVNNQKLFEITMYFHQVDMLYRQGKLAKAKDQEILDDAIYKLMKIQTDYVKSESSIQMFQRLFKLDSVTGKRTYSDKDRARMERAGVTPPTAE